MYCTPDDVRESSELLQEVTIFPDEKISPWIIKAQGRIDAVLRARYVVPLAEPVPEIIKSITQDMAAGFCISNTFSNQMGQEQINLSNQFLKRADADLARVVNDMQLDGITGVKLATIPGAGTAPAISSTTRYTSPVEEIIKQW